MRTIFWIILLIFTYIWVVSSGREQYVIDHGKKACEAVLSWFDDADVDFQSHQTPIVKKKRPRRWE